MITNISEELQRLQRENNALRRQVADQQVTIAHTTLLLERWLSELKSGAVYTMSHTEKMLEYSRPKRKAA